MLLYRILEPAGARARKPGNTLCETDSSSAWFSFVIPLSCQPGDSSLWQGSGGGRAFACGGEVAVAGSGERRCGFSGSGNYRLSGC